ncbi:DNA/RNA polymerases superfamily protein [Gossypium australe]|uniref:DNA/RNA polymerases superfamily protein n=1 Tax=Gossypium australe TaxID=47621 RepID=A0A5B6V9N8_9ROSI|nr:DNA/RNA polymerases superfamily protein [Gossypium australe]
MRYSPQGSQKYFYDASWWQKNLGMKMEIIEYVAKCLVCQQVKAEHHERVTINFVTGLSLSQEKKDSIWMVIERLTKFTHFISTRVNYSLEKLTELYISEIDLRFTSKFWGKFHKALGIRLNFSTTFHSQTDGQLKRIIQVLEDMLRCCLAMEHQNGAFEALYGRKYRTHIHTSIRKEKNEFEFGDKVFLKVSPRRKVLHFDRKKGSLVQELDKIHNVFHVSILRRYKSNPSHQPNLSYGEEPIKILAREVKEMRNKGVALVKV